ncbi:LEAF RUST 10 DISEASE-RESISTANCE LOCUS RECEPTOR-LIKE PROTEIN KINASE-like 1.3 [Silene latifolia]|uniref:LEAF RUST 10 DISEASE-RESISTANCE LOCUS RECEPTOR-LIKE PROTEIN KINASE-like 1.3 n=1 Tax=Silene latifolia TaxID=37657 RepID=UPI003D77C5CB
MKLVLFLVVFLFLLGDSQGNHTWYDSCNRLVGCGSFVPVGYPFWGGQWRPKECGYPHLKISCEDGLTPTIMIDGMEYVVLNINELDWVMRVARKDYYSQGVCLKTFANISLNWNEFRYTPITQNLTVLYGCKPPKSRVSEKFSCKIKGIARDTGYYVDGIVNPLEYHCNLSVVVPSLVDPVVGLTMVFQDGFQLNYTLQNQNDVVFCQTCEGAPSNGSCGYDNSRNRTVCLCPHGIEDIKCNIINSTAIPPTQAAEKKSSKHSKIGLIIGLCVGGGVVLVALTVGIIYFLRNRQFSEQDTTTEASSHPLQQLGQSFPTRPSPNSILEEASTLDLKLFDYKDLEKATDNFAENRELGEGAYTTVYYGKLSDGQEVAVKRFYQHNDKRMEQYMNEVSVLAHLRHKNVLVLYGCTPRTSKEILLVYEYISNGTLGDHLHGKVSQTSRLPWPLRAKIAVETAEGLYFLHQNGVIHRDVKTANILLDNNLQVKVADFGLAKPFPLDRSHVWTYPQGTPGYVDPVYFRHYRLTEKSDVYSFGVVLVELISSKEAVDVTRRGDDINLFSMALDRIQKGEMNELVDSSLRYDVDPTIKTSIDLVAQLAFRCLQVDAVMRPQMVEVLETLKEAQMLLTEYEASTSGTSGQ